MTAIKVHGSNMSTATRRVLATLFEKDVDFEFVPVNMAAGEHKTEAYLKLNPFGQVPAFEDGDLKLFGTVSASINPYYESRAITKHIADEYSGQGTNLICPAGKQKAILSLWIEVEAQKYDPAASKILWEHVFKPMFGMTADAAVLEDNEGKLAKVLDVYEARLGESKYLACDCFTLADLHHLPTLGYLLDTPCKKLIETRPRVAAWVADITARPAWVKVLDMKNKQ